MQCPGPRGSETASGVASGRAPGRSAPRGWTPLAAGHRSHQEKRKDSVDEDRAGDTFKRGSRKQAQ